ncbi:MAG: hypothetical protein U0K68_01885 [Agathobacter sp.]|nr:hypothetical protein [Agathobacter sp.]
MLDKRFYEGYEGEGEVKVWKDDNGDESGIVIWNVFLIQFWRDVFILNSPQMEFLSVILIKMDFMMINGR